MESDYTIRVFMIGGNAVAQISLGAKRWYLNPGDTYEPDLHEFPLAVFEDAMDRLNEG